jgi:hypothetical protein
LSRASAGAALSNVTVKPVSVWFVTIRSPNQLCSMKTA